MGNLGRYQDIVTEAKLAGGVDALITIIEDTAVADRAPGIFGKGVGAGLLIACVVGGGVRTARFLGIRKRDRRTLRDEARAQLKAEIEGQAAPDDSDDDSSDGTDSGSGQQT